jgi:hypothetical protein
MDSLRTDTIRRLKYVFDLFNANQEIIKKLNDTAKVYELAKTLDSETKVDNSTDTILEEIKTHKENELFSIFKNIRILFSIMNNLLKILIAEVDEDKYQKILSEKIEFPNNINKLIIIVGCYGDAFTLQLRESLFNIIDSNTFSELHKISVIPISMIPFVANEEINLNELRKDYEIFASKVKNFACDVLKVNTDFENKSYSI